MKIIFAFIFAISLNAFAESPKHPIVKLKNGNDITIKEKYGSVTYYCSNQNQNYTKHYNCYDASINPGTHDKVVTAFPVDADKVTLKAHRADKSTKTKKVGFDGNETTSNVNLIVRSVTQSPLLKAGTNVVDYKFTKGSDTVLEGNFEATVNVLESKQCRHRSEFGMANECTFESFGCDRYFWLENNCNY